MWTCGDSEAPQIGDLGFNPSVGIPSMWTFAQAYLVRHVLLFQSLSRDSVHVDGPSWEDYPEYKADVSIPQSGFRPCGRDPVLGCGVKYIVSIPQSGFRPCGPQLRNAAITYFYVFQSLSRDSVHVDPIVSRVP